MLVITSIISIVVISVIMTLGNPKGGTSKGVNSKGELKRQGNSLHSNSIWAWEAQDVSLGPLLPPSTKIFKNINLISIGFGPEEARASFLLESSRKPVMFQWDFGLGSSELSFWLLSTKTFKRIY